MPFQLSVSRKRRVLNGADPATVTRTCRDQNTPYIQTLTIPLAEIFGDNSLPPSYVIARKTRESLLVPIHPDPEMHNLNGNIDVEHREKIDPWHRYRSDRDLPLLCAAASKDGSKVRRRRNGISSSDDIQRRYVHLDLSLQAKAIVNLPSFL
jgi:hypothetical protein